MKKCSTMDLDFMISKSYYLQELLLNLPEARLKEVLISREGRLWKISKSAFALFLK